MNKNDSKTLLDLYQKRSPRSHKAFERAKHIFPGGNTRAVVFHRPYPIYILKGQGCRIWDVDGHEILDFIGNYISLILGHSHPKIIEAVKSQLEYGTVFSSPTEYENIFGEKIQERMPSLRSLRFTNSGSESTILAILAAKGFTGRKKIAKFEGAHHGTNEATMVSTKPSLKDLGTSGTPKPIPDGPHISDAVLKNTVVLPFNNQDETEKLILENRKELAAVIVEPILGSAGIIPARYEFISSLREVTVRNDIPLIFDEVVTGFRVSRGGAQEYYGVKPDLTALGKNIGGGFPMAAVGGREDMMAQFDPTRTDGIFHSGSFNANPVCMRAGIALMDELSTDLYRQLDNLGASAVKGLRQLFSNENVESKITHIASLFCVHFTSEEVTDYRSTLKENVEKQFNLFLGLLLNDVMMAKRGIGCVSEPMTNREVDSLVNKTAQVLPYIKESS